MFSWAICLLVVVSFPGILDAAEPGDLFLNYIKKSAAQMHEADSAPGTLEDWKSQNGKIRKQLLESWGGFPEQAVPLEPQILGKLERDGYRIEKVIFQTLPDVWMTANAYVPDRKGQLPAVLCVHGHWPGAKQDPHVQARCIGLAKLGFFVLSVDALGAGERGVGKALGEYHGAMIAAALFPVGKPLSGLQVYEYGRAVDYLLTRDEVDGERIGITGASGGGNQSMYAGAWDTRFKAVVPVCSVGNYQAYLGNACCMCEVVPGALQFTEEWGVLGLTAPRALMFINATRDSIPFSVVEARKSLKLVQPIYGLYGREKNVRHTIFESRHDYNQPMREAMYGWMTLHLKGKGDGMPISEPEINLEIPETLRCFSGETRPDHWVTIPKFAKNQGDLLVEKYVVPGSKSKWRRIAETRRDRLDKKVLGKTLPDKNATSKQVFSNSSEVQEITFESEPGIELTMELTPTQQSENSGTVVLLGLDKQDATTLDELKQELIQSGKNVVIPTLRATGDFAWKSDKIRNAPDHNTAQWSLWLGRPLLGQWALDVRAALNALEANGKTNGKITVIGVGPAGVVAICAAAIDLRIQKVVTIGSLSSYLTDQPYENQRLGTLAPGIVRDAGDIPQLAALIAPRKLIISAGVNGQGVPLSQAELNQQFEYTKKVYELEQATRNLVLLPQSSPTELINLLR
ncbi:MAG: acetylxylan esterase [Planctomycetaceae bacterium]|nr:acetylxylan esterase [Planctomycetaceae bacterium]